MKRCKVPWLTFMDQEDPTFAKRLGFYCHQPHLRVLGPRGGVGVVNFMLECARGAAVPSRTQILVLDDNIRAIGTMTGPVGSRPGHHFHPLGKDLFKCLVSTGARIFRTGKVKAWSVRPHANPQTATEFGRIRFPDMVWHGGRRRDSLVKLSANPNLLYTAVLGLRADMPLFLCPCMGDGQDDLERTIRFLDYR